MTEDGPPVVPSPSEDFLNERQLVMYRDWRESFIEWLTHEGKDPERLEGYAAGTIENTAYRTDKFTRWVWQEEGKFTQRLTHEHADHYMKELLYGDYSAGHKANTQKAIKRLFKWLARERGGEEWDPERQFSNHRGANQPEDYLTLKERRQIREAALEYGTIPGYNDLTPTQRERWKGYIAQRLGKPKSDVVPKDWNKMNGWKFTSLVWVSLDAGLRPIEVERANLGWCDTDNGVLRIPEDESAKVDENWTVSLTQQTSEALSRWLDEREQYEMYEDTDKLWLTREGNSYGSSSLKYILEKLCEIAGIETEQRSLSWYAIRHSLGTYMTREEDLAAAQAQLRHRSSVTTMKYDNAPVEDRRDALDRMG